MSNQKLTDYNVSLRCCFTYTHHNNNNKSYSNAPKKQVQHPTGTTAPCSLQQAWNCFNRTISAYLLTCCCALTMSTFSNCQELNCRLIYKQQQQQQQLEQQQQQQQQQQQKQQKQKQNQQQQQQQQQKQSFETVWLLF